MDRDWIIILDSVYWFFLFLFLGQLKGPREAQFYSPLTKNNNKMNKYMEKLKYLNQSAGQT